MKSPFKLFHRPVRYSEKCIGVEWNRVWKDQIEIEAPPPYNKLKQDIEKEHGYTFSEPHWIGREIDVSFHGFNTLFENVNENEIQIALTRKARELDLSTALQDFWTAYRFYTPVYVELKSIPATAIENIGKTQSLYNWYHKNAKSEESSVDVGVACCTLQIFVNPNKFLLTWWERETQVLSQKDLEEWGNALKSELEQVFKQWADSKGEEYGNFEKFLVKFFSQAHQFTQMVRASTKDPELHFYQNPKWEKYYQQLEGKEWVKTHFAKNHHPDSLKWMKE
jgi:hypothetical protein